MSEREGWEDKGDYRDACDIWSLRYWIASAEYTFEIEIAESRGRSQLRLGQTYILYF
jgi:hypothetical protein